MVVEGLLDNQPVAPNSPHNRHFFDPKERIDVKDELLKRPIANGLTDLDISLNHIGNQGADILSTYIKSKYTSLIKLNISECKIQIRGAVNILRAISQQIYLQDFNIAKNDIGMNLRCNYIFERQHAGIFLHSLELALTASLRIVNFDACHLSDRECLSISEALMDRNFISSLSVKSNKITSTGFSHFSKAVCTPSCQLEELDLSENSITDTSREQLILALTSSTSLRKLYMRKNQLQSVGLILLKTISINQKI